MAWKEIYTALMQGLNPKEQRAVVLGLLVGMFTLHTAWACGLIPGISGFTTPDHVREITREEIVKLQADIDLETDTFKTEVTEEIRNLRVELIIERIDDVQRALCNAESEDLRRELAQKLQRNLAKYRGLRGYSYDLTSCGRP